METVSTEYLTALLMPILAAHDDFLVSLKIGPNNQIVVEIDHMEGITIARCAEVSRALSAALDEKELDYSLEVASATLSAPFAVPLQYKKHQGNPVTVVCRDGLRYDGILVRSMLDNNEQELQSIEVEIEELVKPNPESKKKVKTKRIVEIATDNIKKTTYRFE